LHLTRYHDIETFYARAEPFLLEREAEHNLILGITTGLTTGDAAMYEDPPYLAAVAEGDAVVAIAIRTPPHNLILSVAPPGAVERIALDAHELYPSLPGVLGPRDAAHAFAEAWQRIAGQPRQLGLAQRIYQLAEVTPVARVPGALRRATEADRQLLIEWFIGFTADAFGSADADRAERAVDATLTSTARGLYLWELDEPMSMAGYSGPTPNGIRVGYVYTPPQLRGRGYASACVAALSQFLRDAGCRHCFLFTDLSNPTSNRIYQRIGYRPVADVDEYRFLDPSPAGK